MPAALVLRRNGRLLYLEKAYQDEILVYMSEMDVS